VKPGGAVISWQPPIAISRSAWAQVCWCVAVWLMSRSLCREREGWRSYCWFFTEPNGEQLREIAGLVDSGAIKPVIDREFAFDQLPAALAYLEKGRARGKVVLKVR
jgi:alcohol dehydrogenase